MYTWFCFPLRDQRMFLVVRLHTIEINNKIVHDINPEISWSIHAIAAESVIATYPRYISLFVTPYCFYVSHYKLTFFVWFWSEHWTVSFRRHHCFNFRKQPFSLCMFFILLLYLLNWLHKNIGSWCQSFAVWAFSNFVFQLIGLLHCEACLLLLLSILVYPASVWEPMPL